MADHEIILILLTKFCSRNLRGVYWGFNIYYPYDLLCIVAIMYCCKFIVAEGAFWKVFNLRFLRWGF